MLKRLPIYITWFRVFLIPLLLYAFFSDWESANWIGFYIFLIAGLSDGLDGWLARVFDGSSEFGAFFDPVADKLMVSVAMILLCLQYQSVWITVACAVIIGREIVISALREWNAKRGLSEQSSVSIWGKLKTLAQFFAISFLLIGEQVGFINTMLIGNILLSIAVFLTLFSMVHYFFLTLQKTKN
jgi:CDP-diacylglycerol--glycerol-3-phosphate 3-phosphatidyltransferase